MLDLTLIAVIISNFVLCAELAVTLKRGYACCGDICSTSFMMFFYSLSIVILVFFIQLYALMHLTNVYLLQGSSNPTMVSAVALRVGAVAFVHLFIIRVAIRRFGFFANK
jgi:hypothetical protein